MEINPLALLQAQLLVLRDREVRTDAVFVHASCVADAELDKLVLHCAAMLHAYCDGNTVIVLNGATAEQCVKIPYPGIENWVKNASLLVSGDKVLRTRAALNTPQECDALIDLAVEQGWNSLTLVSLPHHILRVMLQMVYCLKRPERKGLDQKIKVYAHSPELPDWWKEVKRPVIDGKKEDGTLFTQIAGEFTRTLKYMDTTGAGFIPHATPEELIEYIRNRDDCPPPA